MASVLEAPPESPCDGRGFRVTGGLGGTELSRDAALGDVPPERLSVVCAESILCSPFSDTAFRPPPQRGRFDFFFLSSFSALTWQETKSAEIT